MKIKKSYIFFLIIFILQTISLNSYNWQWQWPSQRYWPSIGLGALGSAWLGYSFFQKNKNPWFAYGVPSALLLGALLSAYPKNKQNNNASLTTPSVSSSSSRSLNKPYPTTEETVIQNKTASIIHLGAVELTRANKNINITVYQPTQNDFSAQITKSVNTIPSDQEIVKRQESSQCGLAATYNALKIYKLSTNQINQNNFENEMKQFDPNNWSKKNPPLDENDMLEIICEKNNVITRDQVTIIPNIVNKNNKLLFVPFQNKIARQNSNGNFIIGFENERTLLKAIDAIKNPNDYTHIFFLNNIENINQGNQSFGHWITAVLNKKNNDISLIIANSANDYYGDNAKLSNWRKDRVDLVDLELLKAKVNNDMQWMHALTALLNYDPDVLKLGIKLIDQNKLEANDNYTVNDLINKIPNTPSGNVLREIINNKKS